jgi:hypothetical protein
MQQLQTSRPMDGWFVFAQMESDFAIGYRLVPGSVRPMDLLAGFHMLP